MKLGYTRIEKGNVNGPLLPRRRTSVSKSKFLPRAAVGLLTALLFCSAFAAPVLAEGNSGSVALSLSRTTLNVGKTFTMTLKITPNANVSVNSFDAVLQYDSANLDLVMEGSDPKITKPSGVPSTFKMSATLTGNRINILCNDDSSSQNAPIPTGGKETSLITFTFKVKDAAAVGATVSFSILECSVNELLGGSPTALLLTLNSPKTASIGARLDTNTFLSEIKTSVGALNPVFSKSVTDYLLEVPMTTTVVAVTAKQESSLSKITIAGGSDLAYGDNKVTITVTAQDPDAVKVYTITVRRASPPVSSSGTSSLSEVFESSEDTSSDSGQGTVSGAESSSESTPGMDPLQAALQFWKLIAFLFIGLFVVTGGVMVWLLIDKLGRNGNQIRRIDHDLQNDLGGEPVDGSTSSRAKTYREEKVKVKKVKIKRIK